MIALADATIILILLMNIQSFHCERSMTLCIVCQKAHPMPFACTSNHTSNDQIRTMNVRLTLNRTRTFEPQVSNIR